VKMRPLPDTDVARLSPMSREEKRLALQRMKISRPPHTYHPLRNNASDIMNIGTGLLDAGSRTPWSIIKENIIAEGTSASESNLNFRAGEALYAFAEEHKLRGRRYDISPLPIGVSEKISYWFNAAIAVDGIATLLFMDPRQTEKLSADGRRFVFSAMHQRCLAYPDLVGIRFGVIQLAKRGGSSRAVEFFTNEGIDLIDFATMDAMVRELYDMWRDILEEREEDARRRGGSTTGTLI
jgi:hypothetical protein